MILDPCRIASAGSLREGSCSVFWIALDDTINHPYYGLEGHDISHRPYGDTLVFATSF